ncbi:MAG: hypothetical protein J6Q02_02115, partial [Lachnospiraceae bacterium]|nr:hypothetical protein [Lachnospiraceae bacterium]
KLYLVCASVPKSCILFAQDAKKTRICLAPVLRAKKNRPQWHTKKNRPQWHAWSTLVKLHNFKTIYMANIDETV